MISICSLTQGLLGSTQREVLTVRWAREDPNPTVVVATKRKYVDAFTQVTGGARLR